MYGGCSHDGPNQIKWPDFHWWREGPMGYVGRPPSPFPAPFEHEKTYREDSALPRLRHLGRGVEQEEKTDNVNGEGVGQYEENHRLFWPLCEGPPFQEPYNDELYDVDLINSGVGKGNKKKSPRLPGKRPPWRPAKLPNKFGVTHHPPPYTNYCKESLFDKHRADPMKASKGHPSIRASMAVES